MGLNETHMVLNFTCCPKPHKLGALQSNENYSPEQHFYQRKANVVISVVKSNFTEMIQ